MRAKHRRYATQSREEKADRVAFNDDIGLLHLNGYVGLGWGNKDWDFFV